MNTCLVLCPISDSRRVCLAGSMEISFLIWEVGVVLVKGHIFLTKCNGNKMKCFSFWCMNKHNDNNSAYSISFPCEMF